MTNHANRATLALSVRQPFAEQILAGIKTFEYRTLPTRRRGRVYVYASRTLHDDETEWRKLGLASNDVITGHIIGTVEIIDCDWSVEHHCYRWHLRRPQRIPPRRPRNHPQPVWFYPFSK
jgi:hypothetical protein